MCAAAKDEDYEIFGEDDDVGADEGHGNVGLGLGEEERNAAERSDVGEEDNEEEIDGESSDEDGESEAEEEGEEEDE